MQSRRITLFASLLLLLGGVFAIPHTAHAFFYTCDKKYTIRTKGGIVICGNVKNAYQYQTAPGYIQRTYKPVVKKAPVKKIVVMKVVKKSVVVKKK